MSMVISRVLGGSGELKPDSSTKERYKRSCHKGSVGWGKNIVAALLGSAIESLKLEW